MKRVLCVLGVLILSLLGCSNNEDSAVPLCDLPDPVSVAKDEFSISNDELANLGAVSFLRLTFATSDDADGRFSSLTGEPETEVLIDLRIRRIFFSGPEMLVALDSQQQRDVAACAFRDQERFADWNIIEVAPVELSSN